MTGVHFSFFNPDQIRLLKDKTLDLLADQGVRLDHHPEMFRLLKEAGAQVEEGGADREGGLVRRTGWQGVLTAAASAAFQGPLCHYPPSPGRCGNL